jgi:beta-glucosidase
MQQGFPGQGIGMPLDYTAPHTPIYARDPASQPILLDGAIEGHVLVKNVNKTLPLKSPKLLSIFGYDAVAPPALDIGSPSNPLSVFAFGYEPELTDYVPFVSTGPSPAIAPNGTLISGGKLSYSSNAEPIRR